MEHAEYIPTDKNFGIKIAGFVQSIDNGYRAFIYSDHDIPGTAIKSGDLVKVLMAEGALYWR